MNLSSKYNPLEVEDKWYQHWLDQGFFHSTPNPKKEPYTIVIPPPNVTGVLHMGHMLNNTIQDVLIRRARMMGKEACWVPGTDHASIATEAKVVKMLKDRGINKHDIGRDAFLKHAWEWKEKYGGIILEQLKKLGASCDWDRTRFTMEPDLHDSVIQVFVDLYNKGHIYRGFRMVNWDPEGQTALADDEVIHRDVSSKLYFVKYQLEGDDGSLTIATTRPETILGDTALCVHPEDKRYSHLRGKNAIVPLINRPIPIIQDNYVDMEFGTGCLKVTPAHDTNDYDLGLKHNLEVVDILNNDGSMSENAQLYIGEDRFEARNMIVADLEKEGYIVKIEDYENSVGFSERTDAVVEPRLSLQWYVRMSELTKPAYKNVMNDQVKLVPSKFKNMYKHWMENVRDWCISRQLWWGQRIPAFYLKGEDPQDPEAQIFVAETKSEAVEKAKIATGNPNLKDNDLAQDEDVLDTWFSSGLWPITVFNGIKEPDNEEIEYYYPTNDLVTAPEILFFWIARMIMYGYEYRNEKPFNNVYLTGIVRDKQRRKMSKSLGNSPDPLELIKVYGADGVRTGMLFSSPAGNDLLFDMKLCEQGRNFANKIWNAFRLVKGWNVGEGLETPTGNTLAVKWFNNRFHYVLDQVNDYYNKFRISDALMVTYSLIWDDFCSWYLEMIKPAFEKPIDPYTYDKTVGFFERIIRLLHPFMPFITEEIWHNINHRTSEDCLIVAAWPEPSSSDNALLGQGQKAFEIISKIRQIRNAEGIPIKQPLEVHAKADFQSFAEFVPVIKKLGYINTFMEVNEKEGTHLGFMVGKDEFYIPEFDGLDIEKEKSKKEKELEYTRGFLASVEKKLTNERFVQNAPDKVIETERKKQAEALGKIKALEEALSKM